MDLGLWRFSVLTFRRPGRCAMDEQEAARRNKQNGSLSWVGGWTPRHAGRGRGRDERGRGRTRPSCGRKTERAQQTAWCVGVRESRGLLALLAFFGQIPKIKYLQNQTNRERVICGRLLRGQPLKLFFFDQLSTGTVRRSGMIIPAINNQRAL